MSLRSKAATLRILIMLVALLVALHPQAAQAQTPSEIKMTNADATEAPPLANQIGFFRRILSRADGDRCSMHPSCSTYALDSLRKHGALLGWIMASDRLLRCGHDEVRLAPAVRSGQRRLAYDPVSGNDFWWWQPPETTPTSGR